MRQLACETLGMDTPSKRLKWAREKAGYSSATEAAEARGWTASTYRGHENGQREFPIAVAKRYAAAFKVPWLWLKEGGRLAKSSAPASPPAAIPTRGEVAAGRWLDLDVDLDATDFQQYPIAPDPGYPAESQYGLIVRGSSMNRIARPGDVLHCVDTAIAGIEAREDDIVIVQRRRQQEGQQEVTAKRLQKRGNTLLLVPDSTDPRWKPLELDTQNPPDGEDIIVVAVVIGRYEPFRNRK